MPPAANEPTAQRAYLPTTSWLQNHDIGSGNEFLDGHGALQPGHARAYHYHVGSSGFDHMDHDPSDHQLATCDVQALAGDVGGVLGSQECHGGRDVIGRGCAPERDRGLP